MSVLYDWCIWIVTEMSVDAWSVLVMFCLLDDVSYVRLSRESPGRTGHHWGYAFEYMPRVMV